MTFIEWIAMGPHALSTAILSALLATAFLAGCVTNNESPDNVDCNGGDGIPMLVLVGGFAPVPIPGNGSRETVLGPGRFSLGNGSSSVQLAGAPAPCKGLLLTGEFSGFRDPGRRLVVFSQAGDFDVQALQMVVYFHALNNTSHPAGTFRLVPLGRDSMSVDDHPAASYVSEPGGHARIALSSPSSNGTVTFRLTNDGLTQARWTAGPS